MRARRPGFRPARWRSDSVRMVCLLLRIERPTIAAREGQWSHRRRAHCIALLLLWAHQASTNRPDGVGYPGLGQVGRPRGILSPGARTGASERLQFFQNQSSVMTQWRPSVASCKTLIWRPCKGASASSMPRSRPVRIIRSPEPPVRQPRHPAALAPSWRGDSR